ncbi:M16 family metallopeptidase [Allokutzneria albata]|uniref:Predicted Zn-dependent peptidase n=1 Tax=Allokutzneria albata TaxID=211114 RepID=A0A1G9YEU9_ALLAB|nr:pitrilysin family protein [Allokutzneria albata]SDN07570.1 Predicted Zn-dependent peptidase [Allokutzneria albata]
MTRTAAEIGRTEAGPRPLPDLVTQSTAVEPKLVDTVLDNGLRVIVAQRSTVPMVEFRLTVPFAGERPEHAAQAELLSATLLAGTAKRTMVELDSDLARVGAALSVGVDPEHLSLSWSGLVDGLDLQLDVLADLLTGAAYPEQEVYRERERLVSSISLMRSQPGTIAREALQRHRYGDHPFTREVPTEEAAAAVTVEDVRELHRRAVLPRGSVLVVVGDVEPQQAVDRIAAKLAEWKSDAGAVEMPQLPDISGGDLRLVDRPGAVQSQLRLSTQAVPRTDPRYPALQMANVAFGGFFSSRVVENLREDKGYTYSVHSMFEFTPGKATLILSGDTASEVTAPAVLEARYELGRMCLVPPTESEVDTVRRYLVGSLSIGVSSQAGLASNLAGLASVGLGADWLWAHPDRLRQVTVEQIAEAAAEFFRPTAWTGVVVGDAATLEAPLRALGGVVLS